MLEMRRRYEFTEFVEDLIGGGKGYIESIRVLHHWHENEVVGPKV
jgi:hypothetical protein